jgi:hypothetical protein
MLTKVSSSQNCHVYAKNPQCQTKNMVQFLKCFSAVFNDFIFLPSHVFIGLGCIFYDNRLYEPIVVPVQWYVL